MSRIHGENNEQSNVKRRKRKTIDKDVEVIVTNNTYGMFMYEGSYADMIFSADSRGDEDYVSYGDLRKLKKYMRTMELLITEVNDDDVSIMDVARGLHIDDVYKQFFELVLDEEEETFDDVDSIDVEEIDYFIKECNVDEFKEALEAPFGDTIIAITTELYKRHEIGDPRKLTLVKKTRPKEEQDAFWADIEASAEFGHE